MIGRSSINTIKPTSHVQMHTAEWSQARQMANSCVFEFFPARFFSIFRVLSDTVLFLKAANMSSLSVSFFGVLILSRNSKVESFNIDSSNVLDSGKVVGPLHFPNSSDQTTFSKLSHVSTKTVAPASFASLKKFHFFSVSK